MTKLEKAINKVLMRWLGVEGAPKNEFEPEAKEIAELKCIDCLRKRIQKLKKRLPRH